jgi:hypothetical protein
VLRLCLSIQSIQTCHIPGSKLSLLKSLPGVLLIRGENVVALGEIVSSSIRSITSHPEVSNTHICKRLRTVSCRVDESLTEPGPDSGRHGPTARDWAQGDRGEDRRGNGQLEVIGGHDFDVADGATETERSRLRDQGQGPRCDGIRSGRTRRGCVLASESRHITHPSLHDSRFTYPPRPCFIPRTTLPFLSLPLSDRVGLSGYYEPGDVYGAQ